MALIFDCLSWHALTLPLLKFIFIRNIVQKLLKTTYFYEIAEKKFHNSNLKVNMKMCAHNPMIVVHKVLEHHLHHE
jgi:hypothetical protein